MHKKWTVIFYETSDGRCEISQFLDSLSTRNRAKAYAWFESLETRSPNLPRPYADLLEEGIHELRIKLSGGQYRILYFFCYGDFVVLSHAFHKMTDKVPKSEIHKAKANRTEFVKRYDPKRLKEMTHEDA